MNYNTPDSFRGFPSHNIDPALKDQKKWCSEYIQAFYQENESGLTGSLFKNDEKNMQNYRRLAKGEQDPDIYKPMVGIRPGNKSRSWRNIDFDILPIAPKFVELLIGKMMNRRRRAVAKPIDPKSKEEEKMLKAKLTERILNKKLIEAGLSQDDTVPGQPLPESVDDVSLHVDLFGKDEYALEAMDGIALYFDANEMSQILSEVVQDLIEVRAGGTFIYLDQNGHIKMRRVIPERSVTNNCMEKDFKDLTRFGEFIDVTISELKEMWPGQPEETYKRVAEQATGNKYTSKYVPIHEDDAYTFPYDAEKITIFKAVWLSDNEWTHLVKKDQNGNPRVFRRAPKIKSKSTGKEIMDDAYMKKHPEREIIRQKIQAVYRASWVVGTDYVFDYGLSTNMPREITDITPTKLPVILYNVKKSIIAQIEPIIHDIQRNWLQYQHHVSKTHPSGWAIEMGALENIKLGADGQILKPKEVLRMAMDTGVVLYRKRYHGPSSNQNKPVEPIQARMSDAGPWHWNQIMFGIQMLRNILGINEVEDASLPQPDILKGVAEIAMQGTNNALFFLSNAIQSIYVRSAKMVAQLLPDAARVSKSKGFANALGAKSEQFWRTLESKEMGIIYDDGPDEKRKEYLMGLVNGAVNKGEITADDAFEIENEDNLIRAAWILRKRRKERMQAQEQSQLKMYQAEQEKNIASANAASQAKMQELQMEQQTKMAIENVTFQKETQLEAMKLQNEVIKMKLQAGIDLTAGEQEHLNKMEQIVLQSKWDIKKEKEKPKPVMKAAAK